MKSTQPWQRYKHRLLTLLVILIIFAFSFQSGDESTNQSGWVVQIVINIFTFLHIPTTGYPLAFFVRKVAHFSEYFVLGLTIHATKKELGFPKLRTFIFIIPIIDESIQYFIPGRVSSPIDMSIDACGLLTGMLIIQFLIDLRSRKL